MAVTCLFLWPLCLHISLPPVSSSVWTIFRKQVIWFPKWVVKIISRGCKIQFTIKSSHVNGIWWGQGPCPLHVWDGRCSVVSIQISVASKVFYQCSAWQYLFYTILRTIVRPRASHFYKTAVCQHPLFHRYRKEVHGSLTLFLELSTQTFESIESID